MLILSESWLQPCWLLADSTVFRTDKTARAFEALQMTMVNSANIILSYVGSTDLNEVQCSVRSRWWHHRPLDRNQAGCCWPYSHCWRPGRSRGSLAARPSGSWTLWHELEYTSRAIGVFNQKLFVTWDTTLGGLCSIKDYNLRDKIRRIVFNQT